MPEKTVTIRNPGPIELTQYRVEIGDTIRFVEKINDTQTDLENWAEGLTFCAIDLQSAADQIGTRYAGILQSETQVNADKLIVAQLKSDVTTLKEQSETAAQAATDQAVIATGAAQASTGQADRSELFAGESQSAATIALNTVSSLTPRLGLNIGNWKIEDGELIVSHLTTATPTIEQGDFILTYEEIEDFA